MFQNLEVSSLHFAAVFVNLPDLNSTITLCIKLKIEHATFVSVTLINQFIQGLVLRLSKVFYC